MPLRINIEIQKVHVSFYLRSYRMMFPTCYKSKQDNSSSIGFMAGPLALRGEYFHYRGNKAHIERLKMELIQIPNGGELRIDRELPEEKIRG